MADLQVSFKTKKVKAIIIFLHFESIIFRISLYEDNSIIHAVRVLNYQIPDEQPSGEQSIHVSL